MTAATEHIPAIICVLVWLCVYGCIYVSMLTDGQEGSGVHVYLCICLQYVASLYFRHTQHRWTPSLTMILGVSSLQVLELDLKLWWNLICLPDPASVGETTNMLRPEAAQLNRDWLKMGCFKHTSSRLLALWTLPSKQNNFGQGHNKFFAAPFASVGGRKGVRSNQVQ